MNVPVFLLLGELLLASSLEPLPPLEPQDPRPAAAERLVDPTPWADFDADGRVDLLVLRAGGPARLLRNAAGGRFEEVTQAVLGDLDLRLRAATWVDVDGDGRLDLHALETGGGSRWFRNLDGSLQEVNPLGSEDEPPGVQSAAWIDFDRDGDPDLHLRALGAAALLRNDGEWSFTRIELGEDAGAPAGLPRPYGTAPFAEVQPVERPERAGPSTGVRSGPFAPLASGGAPRLGSAVSFGGAAAAASGSPACVDGIHDQANPGACIGASSTPVLGQLYPLSQDFFFDAAGRLGLGTTSPQADIHRSAPDASFMLSDDPTAASHLKIVDEAACCASINKDVAGGAAQLDINAVPKDGQSSAAIRLFRRTNTTGPVEFVLHRGDGTSAADVIIGSGGSDTYFNSGNVGIGTAFPAVPLHVRARGDDVPLLRLDTDRSWEFRQEGSGPATALKLTSVGGGGGKNFLIDTTGAVGIGTLNPAAKLHVAGNARVEVLTITGGSDLVEGFDTSGEACDPGTVVVIDPRSPGKLRMSTETYDPKVAGVVSGAGDVRPGLRLGQDGVLDGETDVAMTGRVFVKASAENGAIAPGDLLTTAATRGHAMRADDPDRAFGAVIGKAMGALDEGTGLVLVLVNLQ